MLTLPFFETILLCGFSIERNLFSFSSLRSRSPRPGLDNPPLGKLEMMSEVKQSGKKDSPRVEMVDYDSILLLLHIFSSTRITYFDVLHPSLPIVDSDQGGSVVLLLLVLVIRISSGRPRVEIVLGSRHFARLILPPHCGRTDSLIWTASVSPLQTNNVGDTGRCCFDTSKAKEEPV